MKSVTFGTLIVLAASTASSFALAQDVAAGKSSFNKCLACHAVGDNAKNKVGPELNGLNGRKSGTAEGYSYSDANKNSGITWDEATFKEYIKDPKAKIPGTKMSFAGIKKDTEINDQWAFITQYDKDGKVKKRQGDVRGACGQGQGRLPGVETSEHEDHAGRDAAVIGVVISGSRLRAPRE